MIALPEEHRAALLTSVERHEGFRAKPYQDTKGLWTIGYGTNFDAGLPRRVLMALFNAGGLTEQQARAMTEAELEHVMERLERDLPWVHQLDYVRRRVIIELAYNMGMGDEKHGLLSFNRPNGTLEAVRIGEYARAAKQLLMSKWARDVGVTRSRTLARMLETGEE
jgi:lysozyme